MHVMPHDHKLFDIFWFHNGGQLCLLNIRSARYQPLKPVVEKVNSNCENCFSFPLKQRHGKQNAASAVGLYSSQSYKSYHDF